MKSFLQIKSLTRKAIVTAVFALVILQLAARKAFSQIDYFYGVKAKGLSVGIGQGIGVLITHYHSNPFSRVAIGSLDYSFSRYLSIGLEGQYGNLKGVDDLGHLYYQSSTIKYYTINFNVKATTGLICDFDSKNKFTDALKRFYIGTGAGFINNNVTFTYNPLLEPYPDGTVQQTGRYLVIPFDFGTNIDMRGFI